MRAEGRRNLEGALRLVASARTLSSAPNPQRPCRAPQAGMSAVTAGSFHHPSSIIYDGLRSAGRKR
jgi:hypothetical protein